jgi:serine/threonine protein kinase
MLHHNPTDTLEPIFSRPTILLSHDDTAATISHLQELSARDFRAVWQKIASLKPIKTVIFNDRTLIRTARPAGILNEIEKERRNQGKVIENIYFLAPSLFIKTLIDGLKLSRFNSNEFNPNVFINAPIHIITVNYILEFTLNYFSFFVGNYSEEYSVLFFPQRKIGKEDIANLNLSQYPISDVHFSVAPTINAIKALPKSVNTLLFHCAVSGEMLEKLPSNFKNVGLHSSNISRNAIVALPNTVIQVSFCDGVSAEEVSALGSTKVESVTFTPEVSRDAIKALPLSVKHVSFAGFVDNYINYIKIKNVLVEKIIALPKTVASVTFAPHASKKAIKALASCPWVMCVIFARDIVAEKRLGLFYGNAKYTFTTPPKISKKFAALPQTVDTVVLPPTVCKEDISALPQTVVNIYLYSELGNNAESKLFLLLSKLPNKEAKITIISPPGIVLDLAQMEEFITKNRLSVTFFNLDPSRKKNPIYSSFFEEENLPSAVISSDGEATATEENENIPSVLISSDDEVMSVEEETPSRKRKRNQAETPKKAKAQQETQQLERELPQSKSLQKVAQTIHLEDLQFLREIGGSLLGKVFAGKWLGATEVAIKGSYANNDTPLILDNTLRILQENYAQRLRKEAAIMAKLTHPNLVTLYGVVTEPQFYIVMELMTASLAAVLASDKDLNWSLRYRIGLDIANGLYYLHRYEILHQDLKSSNVLLNHENRAKLSGYGTSKYGTTSIVHSSVWTAPELLTPLFMRNTTVDYEPPCDVYSFAVVLWELASREKPKEIAPWELVCDSRQDIPPNTPQSMVLLITRCWAQEANIRPKMKAVVEEMSKIVEKMNKNPVVDDSMLFSSSLSSSSSNNTYTSRSPDTSGNIYTLFGHQVASSSSGSSALTEQMPAQQEDILLEDQDDIFSKQDEIFKALTTSPSYFS